MQYRYVWKVELSHFRYKYFLLLELSKFSDLFDSERTGAWLVIGNKRERYEKATLDQRAFGRCTLARDLEMVCGSYGCCELCYRLLVVCIIILTGVLGV